MASVAVDLVLTGQGGKFVALKNGEYVGADIEYALNQPANFDAKAYKLAKILSI